jgi:hypothetical protein
VYVDIRDHVNKLTSAVLEPLRRLIHLSIKSERRLGKAIGLSNLLIVITLGLSFALYALIFPITLCNDPLDPRERERVRKEWRQEELAMEETRRRWRQEREAHEKEEENRRRAHLYWSDLDGSDQCTSYNAREYTAQLRNLSPGLNRLEACLATPITIHGTTLDKPEWCEERVCYLLCRLTTIDVCI